MQLAPGLSLTAADVAVRGSRGALAPVDFNYDAATGLATWRLAAPLQNDNCQENVGAGHRTRLLVLPGDVNGDKRVNALDVAEVKRRLSLRAGDAGYSAFADVTADTVVNALDVAAVKRNLGRLVTTLSAAAGARDVTEPKPVAPAATAGDAVAGLTDGITTAVLEKSSGTKLAALP